MTTTSRILHDVANHYNRLIVEHQKLDKEVIRLHDTYQPDHVIKAAKLNKLHLKQEIETIKNNLRAIVEYGDTNNR